MRDDRFMTRNQTRNQYVAWRMAVLLTRVLFFGALAVAFVVFLMSIVR